jgi:hypothetical protein
VAAAVVAAEVVAAEVAVLAEAAAEVAVAPAVHRGVLAAGAKPGHSPIKLTNVDRLGRARQKSTRPILV